MSSWNSPTTLLRVVQTDPEDQNTDQLLQQVQRSHQFQRLLNTVMIAGLVAVLTLSVMLLSQKSKQDTAIVQLTSSLGQTCTQTNTGVLPAAVQVDCDRAQRGEVPEVVQGITGAPGSPGATGATGPSGPAGAEGQPGEGITGTTLDPVTGHLIVTYTGGGKVDLGAVVGKDGVPGIAGGTGASGRGVASVAIVDGRMVVTYTDGTTSDAGAAPVGPAGKDGINGVNGAPGVPGADGPPGADGRNGSPAASLTITRSDGTTVVCPRDEGSSESAPSYSCPVA